MSNAQTPAGRQEKAMSSRLLTMKFMQRAAASSQPPTPLAPSSEPPTKRQRISISKSQSPLASPISADVQAFHAAADLEEAKRTAAIERIAAEAGETKWVLSTADAGQTNGTDRKLRFLTAGYSDIDQATAQATGLRHGEMGRRSFGRFNKDIEKQQNGTATSSASSSSDDESEQGHGDDTYSEDREATNEDQDPTAALIQQTRRTEEAHQRAKADSKAKKKAEKAEAARLAVNRRSKEVRLNKLSSISGGGGGAGIECHFCGQKGHKKADCPRRTMLKQRNVSK